MINKSACLAAARLPAVLEDKILFWMNRCQNSQLHLVIYLNGYVNEDILAKAVRLTLDFEPVLGCKFVNKFYCPFWERHNNLDSITHVRLTQTIDSDSILSQIFEKEYIDTELGPQIKVWVIRSESDIICIKGSHVAMDGVGIKEYGYLLADIYQKLAKGDDIKPVRRFNGSRSLLQVSSNFTTWDKIKIVRRSVKDFISFATPLLPVNSYQTNRKPYKLKLIVRSLDIGMLQSIKKFGKIHQATMNDVMVSLFMQSFYRNINSKPHTYQRLVSTCDLRRYIPTKRTEAICNMSGFTYINIGKNLEFDLVTILKKVGHQMNYLKEDFIGLGNLPISMLIFKFLPFAMALRFHDKISDRMKMQLMTGGNVSPLFTNAGIVELDRLEFGDIGSYNAYVSTVCAYPPVLAFCICGCATSLTITAGFCENTIGSNDIWSLISQIEDEIKNFQID